MVDFKKLLPGYMITRMERERVQINHLWNLDDRFLAYKLLQMARSTREAFPEKLGNPNGISYDPSFVWHVIPEIAKRLGATGLLPNEATALDIITDQGNDFRISVGSFLRNNSINHWCMRGNKTENPMAAELLTNEVANGNPVAFALDRICPVDLHNIHKDDWLARHMLEISERRGFDATPYWSPELMEPREKIDEEYTSKFGI